MIEDVFGWLLKLAAIYTACGLVLAALFEVRWLKSFDPSASAGSWGFRLMILPGLVVLWPVIAVKVVAGRRGGNVAGPAETPVGQEALRRHHSLAWVGLVLLAFMLFAVALTWRAPRLEDLPPQKIALTRP